MCRHTPQNPADGRRIRAAWRLKSLSFSPNVFFIDRLNSLSPTGTQCLGYGQPDSPGGGSMCLDRFARLIVMVFVFVCCIRSAATLWAQTATGRIVGSVTDPTGAVITGATITTTTFHTIVTDTLKT